MPTRIYDERRNKRRQIQRIKYTKNKTLTRESSRRSKQADNAHKQPRQGKPQIAVTERISPTVLIFFGRSAAAVIIAVVAHAIDNTAPVLALSAVMLVYLLHSRPAPEYRPGIVWHVVIVVGTLIYFALSVYALTTTIAGLKW
jgi:Flp pilus assembly protein TadB